MSLIVSTDWHLTDRPQDEYRWQIFEKVYALANEHNLGTILLLGDLWDRKNNHSGVLLNRSIKSFKWLQEETGAEIYVLGGNHDMAIFGQHYWEFLDRMQIHYITQPFYHLDAWLLPFSANPMEDWRGLLLHQARAIFMHQTVAGALIEGNRRIDKTPCPMPPLPRGIPIFSGDVHRPQKVGSITYIGVPHPTRFGESWPNRLFIIKYGDYQHPIEISITGVRKLILDICEPRELFSVITRPGDQVKVKCSLPASQMERWPAIESDVRAWAARHEVLLSSIEASIVIEDKEATGATENVAALTVPQEVLRSFAAKEQISDDNVVTGLELLSEALTCAR